MNRADPNENLVSRLIAVGYTPSQISHAQETLWNTIGSGEGGYDDAEAVERLLRQLHRKEEEISSSGSEYETDSEDDDEEEETKGRSSEHTNTSNAAAFTNGHTSVASTSGGVMNVKPSINFAQRPLSAKLSYVARDVQNLPDAIFALNEWTLKAASRGEVERYLLEFMAVSAASAGSDAPDNEMGPLRTIVQRVLLHADNPKQDQAIILGCANWITSILLGPACHLQPTRNSHNNKVTHSTTMKKAVAEVLRRGRACLGPLASITTCEQLNAQEFSRFVSTSILELLQRAATQKQIYEKQPSNNCVRGSDSQKKDSIVFSSHSQAQMLVKQVESDIAVLAAKLADRKTPMTRMPSSQSSSRQKPKNNISAAASSVVVDLMNRRDRSKQIADKSGIVVEISVHCKKKFGMEEFNVEGKEEEQTAQDGATSKSQLEERNALPKSIAGQYQSTDEKNTLVLRCLGSSLHTAVSNSVSEVTALETKIEGVINQSSSEKDQLTTRQVTIATKRQEISSRMEQIRRELEELSRQDEQLAAEETEVIVELDRLARKTDKEIDGLKVKMEDKAIYVTLDRELRRAVDKLGELEIAWIRSTLITTSATSPVGGASTLSTTTEELAPSCHSTRKQSEPPLPMLLPTKLGAYLNRARSYFQSEAACVEFLRNRVSAAEAEVLDLEREIQVFSNLGMKNNVEKMTHRLMTLKNHVEEDTVVIEALRKDAKEMRGDLIRRVDEYYDVMEKRGDETDIDGNDNFILNPEHIAALEGISIDLTGIGFYDDEDGGLGGVFSKIPKRVPRALSSIDASSENDGDRSTSFIGDIHMLPEIINDADAANSSQHTTVAALVEKVVMPKFSWANNATALPRKEAKSLLEIQMEELSAKKKNSSA